jgi:hypothetical protein
MCLCIGNPGGAFAAWRAGGHPSFTRPGANENLEQEASS